jgi:catechol 2,3-dioxygenase-like lactoylglutathione lyase family enzyme
MTARFLDVVPRVPVTDLAATTGYYANVLGFSLGMTWPDEQPAFAIMSRDDATVQFYLAEDPAKCGAMMLNVHVTDAMSLHAELREKVSIEWGPEVYWYGRREFAVRDPDGNLVIITEETGDPATVADD